MFCKKTWHAWLTNFDNHIMFVQQMFFVHGSLMSIAKGFGERTISSEMAEIRKSLLSCGGEGRRRKGKVVDYSADLIIVDLPTGIVPDGFTVTPPWNYLHDGLLDAALQLVSAILDDSGFAVIIMSMSHRENFFRSLRKTGLVLQRSVCLRGLDPFGITANGVQVNGA